LWARAVLKKGFQKRTVTSCSILKDI